MSVPEITQAKKDAFLAAFAECGNLSEAARIADITRRMHYHWMRDDEEYAHAYAEALEEAADRLESEARRRAVDGVDEPVGWFRGEAGGVIRRYSDTLLIFLLKGVRPHKYRDNTRAPPADAETEARRLKDALDRIEETDGE